MANTNYKIKVEIKIIKSEEIKDKARNLVMSEYIDLVQPFRWDNLLGNTMDSYLIQRELAFSQSLFLGETQISSLLEVGCGSGRLTQALCGMIPNVVGLDFDSTPPVS